VSYVTLYCVCYQASHIDERDRDGGRESGRDGGRDGGRDRDRGEEHHPRASGGYSGSGRNTEDGTGGHAANEDRKALQSLMRGLAESDAEIEVTLYSTDSLRSYDAFGCACVGVCVCACVCVLVCVCVRVCVCGVMYAFGLYCLLSSTLSSPRLPRLLHTPPSPHHNPRMFLPPPRIPHPPPSPLPPTAQTDRRNRKRREVANASPRSVPSLSILKYAHLPSVYIYAVPHSLTFPLLSTSLFSSVLFSF
jgi:hypothetical protein